MDTNSLEDFVDDIKRLKKFNETFEVIGAVNKQINDPNQKCVKWEFVEFDEHKPNIIKNGHCISLLQGITTAYGCPPEFEVSSEKKDDPIFREFFLKSLNKNMSKIIGDMYDAMKEDLTDYRQNIKDDTEEIMDDLKDEI